VESKKTNQDCGKRRPIKRVGRDSGE